MSETKMYSVLDKWTDLEKENIVDFTSVDGVVTEARVNGVPAGGGGVTTRTITGTLANPFGDEDWETLAYALDSGNVSAYITIDGSGAGLPPITMPVRAEHVGTTRRLNISTAMVRSNAVDYAFTGLYSYNPDTLDQAYLYYGGTTIDMLPMASNIATTLTLHEVG